MADDDPTVKRLEDQIAWYDSRSLKNQRIFKVLKVVVILAASLIPFLAGGMFRNGYWEAWAFSSWSQKDFSR